MIILGIDPGSRITGFGLVDNRADRIGYVASGSIRVKSQDLPQRLGEIFVAVGDVIAEHAPELVGIENVFMSRNADSALKLGQARGAAICAAHQAGLDIAEYAPREIKQAIVGSGAASKEQVQDMVKRLLGLSRDLQADEADGLAIAICHAQFHRTRERSGIDPALLKRRRHRRR